MTATVGLVTATLVAGLAPPAAAAPAPSAAVVEQRVLDEMAAGATAVFWVDLHRTADLAAAGTGRDWSTQGRLVHHELTATATRTQARLLDLLAAAGAEHQSFWIANTVRVTGDERLLRDVAALPEVARVSADRPYRLPEPIPAPGPAPAQAGSVEWGVDRIRAPRVWSDFDAHGEGIVIGSIDSGVQYDHDALVNQYRGNLGNGGFDHSYNWHDPTGRCGDPATGPCDGTGHGTHTTGTMVGDDGRGNRIGVAPGATWIAARGCAGQACFRADLLSAAQFMLAPTDLDNQNANPDLRPHVINNSWGGLSGDDPWFRQAVRAWRAAGIFPQFAAGNTLSGTAPCGSAANPGNLPESYAAGAFDVNGEIAAFSNRGPSAFGDGELVKPDIAAPGVAVRSAWNDGGYDTVSGTSMASPHVAGAVALMWSAALDLQRDVAATLELLDRTAIDTADLTCGGTPADNHIWGQGRLDAYVAVEQSPRGDTGVLTGRITDVGTGEPIPDVTVTISGPVERERITDENGVYRARLPLGDYAVTTSAFLHTDRTAQVTVAGAAARQDFRLALEAIVILRGSITDGSGRGGPLPAEISVVGTAVSTSSDPATGRYSMPVPADATHTVTVRSEDPGYERVTATVETGFQDVVRDHALVVDAVSCVAAGYQLDPDGVLAENFDSGTRPAGWEVVDNLGNGQVWRFDNPFPRTNITGGEGEFAIVDSEFYGLGRQDTELVSPVLDLTGVLSPVLSFKQHFEWESAGSDEFANVDITVDGGATWVNLLHQAGQSAYAPATLALPGGGEPEVRVRFHYGDANLEWWWMIDDVAVGNCAPA